MRTYTGTIRHGSSSRCPAGPTPRRITGSASRSPTGRRRRSGVGASPPGKARGARSSTCGPGLDARALREHCFDGLGPHVLAAADDEVTGPPEHVHAPVARVDLAEVTGGEPSVRILRIGAVAVHAQQHRTAQLDLAARSADTHFD